MKQFRFERLDVWQAARALNRAVYQASKRFPASEQYALTSQLRRASISVSSNIAEGAGRNSDRDFAHFLEQAYGSLMEVASQLFLAMDEAYLAEAEAATLLAKVDALAGQLVTLNRALNVDASKVKLPATVSDATRHSRKQGK